MNLKLIIENVRKSGHRPPRFAISRSKMILVGVYLLLTVAVSTILFMRFPNNVLHANFYGEDGSVYLQNIIDKGWLPATVSPFNGYAIIGLYLLEGAAWLANALFDDGSLITLPPYLALVSIVFMAAVISLPYLLFRKNFGTLAMLLVVVMGALVPLPLSPHIVIGTVGNQKWVFMYLATLLVIYRLANKRLSLRRLIVIDATLLVCAYTNSTVYTLFPLLLLPPLVAVWQKRKRQGLLAAVREQLHNRAVRSLLTVCVLLIPQVLYVIANGIPKLPGYLDTPYQFNKTVEVFINRTFDFGVTHSVNGYMSDIAALLLFGILVVVGWRRLAGPQKIAFWVSLYAAGMASLLFVGNRHGVTDFFNGYQPSGSGPDQFFYAQTLIMYLPIVLAAFACASYVKNRRLGYGLLGLFVAFVIGSGIVSDTIYGARWRGASVFENATNTFVDQALAACSVQSGQAVRVTVYPYPDGRFALTAPRDQVCAPQLQNYQASVQLLQLAPDNNKYITLTGASVQQTFKADKPNLNGVRIFLSNFNKPQRDGDYTLAVYDSACRHKLRTATIPTSLVDNSLYNARFAPIGGSKGQTYCFQVLPPPTPPYDPLAVQQSAPNIYPAGQLTLGGSPQKTDLVFEPLYTQTRPKH